LLGGLDLQSGHSKTARAMSANGQRPDLRDVTPTIPMAVGQVAQTMVLAPGTAITFPSGNADVLIETAPVLLLTTVWPLAS
jgi:hypothetical protein